MENKANQEADRLKTIDRYLTEIDYGLQTKTKALVIEELDRASKYLKNPLSAREYETLLKQSPPQLILELQQIAAAVELRQKTEVAEFIRRTMEQAEDRETAFDHPEQGGLMGQENH